MAVHSDNKCICWAESHWIVVAKWIIKDVRVGVCSTLQPNRIALDVPLNLTAEDLAQQPKVRDAAIDMGGLLSRPQVVYFHLKSPIEPIGSPAVAKLALYSLFAAAAHRLQEENTIGKAGTLAGKIVIKP